MNINISKTLSEEELDSVSGVIEELNASLEEKWTVESYLSYVLNKAIDGYVATAYENSLRELGDGAKLLPYSSRKAIIQQVKSALP